MQLHRKMICYGYMKEKHISAAVSILNHQVSYSAESNNITTNTPLSIHSISKVFTGMLLMKMIRDGIIDKDDLQKPIQLNNDVISQLSDDVQPKFRVIYVHYTSTNNFLSTQRSIFSCFFVNATNRLVLKPFSVSLI